MSKWKCVRLQKGKSEHDSRKAREQEIERTWMRANEPLSD